jgi:hypothetical protein
MSNSVFLMNKNITIDKNELKHYNNLKMNSATTTVVSHFGSVWKIITKICMIDPHDESPEKYVANKIMHIE